VQDILENFKFRNHIPTLSRSDSLGTLISKFLDPQVDLSPAALDNHAMGTVFEGMRSGGRTPRRRTPSLKAHR
jgi:type I restriction enzyme M protein